MCDPHIGRAPRERIVCGPDDRPALHRARVARGRRSATSARTTWSSSSPSSSTCTASPTPSSCRPPISTACSSDGAGFAGFAAGDDRPGAARPGPGGDAGRPLAHAAAVAARGGPPRLRRARGGRGVALLPAHDPAPPARARPLARLRVHARRRARVLPRPQARRRLDRAGRPARHPRPALLRHARPDPQPRLRVQGRAQHHRRSAGTTTPPTTRTRTASSSRTSTSRTRSPPATGRSSSATWSSRWRRSAA